MLSEDRERWKVRVWKRMNHLYEWEIQKGHWNVWEDEEEILERNSMLVMVFGMYVRGMWEDMQIESRIDCE